ncbi:unnamed protein product [Ranitomeya imitator]|uniref:Uncharacterized protein n=1 Tax=Ranitomeya imitator TaxID=111125 RepID=A0ABN9M473_9NEOB|nr:unnamed protein product [Ranitomeya imitator]
MSKSDIEQAFRLLLVHPDCHHLLPRMGHSVSMKRDLFPSFTILMISCLQGHESQCLANFLLDTFCSFIEKALGPVSTLSFLDIEIDS